MKRVDPGFRFPAELPPPKTVDYPFVTLIGVVTILVLLGLLYMAARSAGWL